jgi:hypothetical protein
MKESELSIKIDPLKELLGNYTTVLNGYREKTGKKLAGFSCEFLPLEIIHSFGIQPLTIPHDYSLKCCSGRGGFPDMFDAVIYPRKCSCSHSTESFHLNGKSVQFYSFDTFSGYGRDASIALHESTEKMLKSIFNLNIKDINIESLAGSVRLYNEIRSLVRGILELRKKNSGAISNCDLSALLDAAFSLPPEIVKEYILEVFKALKSSGEKDKGFRVNVMVYSSMPDTGKILDEIEDAGCLVYEDDQCIGRRRFDMSYNESSEYLYYEILDAFSYRPLCPSLRDLQERFELLYKMIKKHGIDAVIFIKDGCCGAREEQIEDLRILLMRSCVDVISVSKENCLDSVREYIEKL